MSPSVRQPLSLLIDAVLAGSLWYSNGRPPAKYTTPGWPGGSSRPSAPTMWHSVIGVPDAEMGEAVKAVVEPVDPAQAGDELAAELLAYCRAELATYKCPRSIDFTTELPRGPNGKLYKRQLREQYWQGHESRVI